MAVHSASSSASYADQATKEAPNIDIERGTTAVAHLLNTTVHSFAWKGITVTVKDRETKLPKTLVDNAYGIVEAGPSPLPSPFLPPLPPLAIYTNTPCLISSRRDPRPARPLRIRQDHPPEHPRLPPDSRIHPPHLRHAPPQRTRSLPIHPPLRNALRRTGR
jgi:hypothetical protein